MENILVIQTAFIGDLILTTGLFQEIKKVYPNSRVTVIINSGTESILENNPYIDSILPFDKKKVKKDLWYFGSFIKNIRKQKFTICISFHFSHRSSILSFLSGAKIRIGYKQSGFSFFHTKKIDRPILGKHEVQKLYSLLSAVELEDPKKLRPCIYITENESSSFSKRLSNYNLKKQEYIVIAPSSIWETKRMPSQKFVELITLILSNTNLVVILVGSKSDIELCSGITSQFKERCLDLSGKTSLRELSYVIQNSKAVVSNDSSPVHIASAFNIPIVAIFGATIPSYGYTPLSDKIYIAEVENLPCRSCGIHGGKSCPEIHFKCMVDQEPRKMFLELMKF